MQILGLSDSTPKPTSRFKELFWPKIEDDVAAVTAARNAMYACFAIAAFGAFALLAALQNPFGWLDVAMYVMIGIGVRQLSRTAAFTAFILYGLSWLAVAAAGTVALLSIGTLIRVILTALLLGGVRAATWAHSEHRETAIEEVANPSLSVAGVSRATVAVENLPNRLWPILKAPFFVTLYLVVFLNLAVLSLSVIVQQWSWPTGSMEKTLLVGDQVVSLRRAWMGDVRRGDVILFRNPADLKTTVGKRVVGTPGDRIKIVNKELYLNATKVSEPYVEHVTDYVDSYRDNFPLQPNSNIYPGAVAMLRDTVRNGEIVVPQNQYFVLGDNRDQSLDSRYLGFVPASDVAGRIILVVYSREPKAQGRTMQWIPRVELGY